MQSKPSDTPKIVALVVAIVVVLVFVVYQIISATQSPPGPTTSNIASGTTGTASTTAITPIQVATASDTEHPGEVRYIRQDPKLDGDPSADDIKNNRLTIPPNPGNMFRIIDEPKQAPPIVKPTKPPVGNSAGHGSETGTGLNPLNPTPPTPTVPAFHYITRSFKLEGVVTGTDGFAMLTEGESTYFKHVGDTLAGYRVMRLHENGMTVRPVGGGEAQIWPIGEVTQVSIKVPGPAPASMNGLHAVPMQPGTTTPGLSGFPPATAVPPAAPNTTTQTVPTVTPH